MNYREAIKASREGKLIRRKNWEEETLLFMRLPQQLSLSVISSAKSLPEAFRNLFRPNPLVHIPFSEHLCRFDGNEVENSVVLSQEDYEANDWETTSGL